MASRHREDEGGHHMYPSDQWPYTVPYTGSAAVRVGSGHVASSKVAGPGVVRTRDDIIDTSNDPGHDLAVAAGVQVNVPDYPNTSSSCQTHQIRSTDSVVANDGSVFTPNTSGIVDTPATTEESCVKRSKPLSIMQDNKDSGIRREAANMTDEEIRGRIDGLKALITSAMPNKSAYSFVQVDECIREWQTILDVRAKVSRFPAPPSLGGVAPGLAEPTDEEKKTRGLVLYQQPWEEPFPLEVMLPSGIIPYPPRTPLEKTKNAQKAAGKPGRVEHDGNVDLGGSEDYEIVDRKETEELWELI